MNCLRLGVDWLRVKNSWETNLVGRPTFSWVLPPGTHEVLTVKIREKVPPVSRQRWGKATILKYTPCSPQQRPGLQGKFTYQSQS